MEKLLSLQEEDDGWVCRKHRSAQRSHGGVCPVCVRQRLLGLCPDCAAERPFCKCSLSSSASSSSATSLSSLDIYRSYAAGTSVGSVGRVSNLIDDEPAFRRSRSAAFRCLMPKSGVVESDPGQRGWKGRFSFWRVHDQNGESKGDADNVAAAVRLSRSRSVGTVQRHLPGSGEAKGDNRDSSENDGKPIRWHRYFRSSFWPLRRRKSSKVIQSTSPHAEANSSGQHHSSLITL